MTPGVTKIPGLTTQVSSVRHAGFDIPVGSPGGLTVQSRVPGKIPGTPRDFSDLSLPRSGTVPGVGSPGFPGSPGVSDFLPPEGGGMEALVKIAS